MLHTKFSTSVDAKFRAMISTMKSLRISRILLLMSLVMVSTSSFSGDEEYSEEMIKRELSFIAKKLLDVSGKDSYTLSSEVYMRPFIGICSELKVEGILITCVTPGTQAEKNGLLTGDIVTQINETKFMGPDVSNSQKAYYSIVKKMKTGDLLKMKLLRNGESLALDVSVGAISHPSFTLQVNK